MGLNIRRRIPALIAATAIAGGLTAVSATGAFAETAAKPSPCAKAHDKYHGTLIKSFKILGLDSDGHVAARGGTLQVWRSAKCETVWVRTVKLAKYTNVARETAVGITYDDVKLNHSVRNWRDAMTRGSLETQAVHAGRHGKAWVEGGFLGDYQFDSGHNVRF